MSSPSGSLIGRANFPLGDSVSDVKTGDLDGDGREDVALATTHGTQVFLNVCVP